MNFTSPLVQGTLIKRYKRFLADIKLTDRKIITVHCPNTGTMLSCSDPGNEVCISKSDNPKRKYPFTLEMVKSHGTWVGVNTHRTNKLVVEGITKGQINEFIGFTALKTEVKVSDHSRLDLRVTTGNIITYVEIKNCSLAINGCAQFPDAVTVRGKKHLHELEKLAGEGLGACIFFLVQRMDAERFAPAVHIDPEYSAALRQAEKHGVRILVYQAAVNPEGIHIIRSLPYSFEA